MAQSALYSLIARHPAQKQPGGQNDTSIDLSNGGSALGIGTNAVNPDAWFGRVRPRGQC